MTNKGNNKLRNMVLYGCIVAALAVAAYYTFYHKSDSGSFSTDTAKTITAEKTVVVAATAAAATATSTPDKEITVAQSTPKPEVKVTDTPKPEVKATETPKPAVKATEAPKLAVKQEDVAVKILKSEVTATAKFYPYKSGDTAMEVLAVKATDGSIRTALNTCQVCYDSGRGYYKQEGEYMVCQNCGNRFHIDQIEKVKGGCNPVPILEENKKDTGDSITISKEFMDSQKQYFSEWKR